MATIYKKIQSVKVNLQRLNLKKTGENKFAKFKYYELSDFLPSLVELCEVSGLFTSVSFDNDVATLTVINSEKPEETVCVTSPMRNLELKGCNEIQALGGVQTYQRRYLYMSLFDIVENDMFDATNGQKSQSNDIPKKWECVDCGKPFEPYTDKNGKTWNAGQVYHMAENYSDDKKARCKACREKREKQNEPNNN